MNGALPEPIDQTLLEEIQAQTRRGDQAASARVQNLLFDVRRGRRTTDGGQALDLAHACFKLGLVEDVEAWANLAQDCNLDAGQRMAAKNFIIISRSQRGLYGDALRAVNEIGDLPPDVPLETLVSLAINAGQVEEKMGLPRRALARYHAVGKVAARKAMDARMLSALEHARGSALNMLGRDKKAIAAYERSLELADAPRPDTLLNLGNALRSLHRYAEAERRYQEASAAAPDDRNLQASVLSNHGRLLAAQGNTERARVMLRDAFALRERTDAFGAAITAEELAKLCAQDADYEAAVVWARAAIKLRASTGQQEDAWLRDFSASMEAIAGELAERPDVAAVSLLQRLRAAVPGEWPAILSSVPADVIQQAAEQLRDDVAPSTAAAPGREVEERWMLAFLKRILAVGPDLAFAEESERMTDVGQVIRAVLEILDAEHWAARKRRYEARREALEQPLAAEVMQVMESRVSELAIEPGRVQDLRQLTEECKAKGVDVAFAELAEEYPEELINRLLMIGTWQESLRLVEAHPGLCSTATIRTLEETLEATANQSQRARLAQHISILRQSLTLGPARAFAGASTVDGVPLGTKFVYARGPHDADDADVAEAEAIVAAATQAGDAELLKLATLALHEAELGNACRVLQVGTGIDDPARLDRAARAFTRAGWHEEAHVALQRLGHQWLQTTDGDRSAALRAAADAFQRSLQAPVPPTESILGEVWLSLGTTLWELWCSGGQATTLDSAQHAFSEALDASPAEQFPQRARAAGRGLYDTASAFLGTSPPPSQALAARQHLVRACHAVIDAADQAVLTGETTDLSAELAASLWAYQGAVEELCTLGFYGAALAVAEHGRARGFLAEIGPSSAILTARDRGTARSSSDATGLAGQPDADELIAFLADQDPEVVVLAWYTTATDCYAFILHGGSRKVRGRPTGLGPARLEAASQLAADSIWQRPERPDDPLSPAWHGFMESLVPAEWRELLEGAREIILVPHGTLAGLPLQALPIRWMSNQCLLDIAPVRYLPGLAVANRLSDCLTDGETALVMAYDHEQAPGVESEFERESKMVAATIDTDCLYVGPQARIAPIFELAPRARLMHIAAHAQFNGASPLESGIFLSDGTQGGTELLTARDVMHLPALPGPVIVLSGCETGRQSADLTCESHGFVRAFLIAGARAVVASQWRVDSRSTRALMEQFHRSLRDTGDVAGSLRAASLSVRVSPETSHPYYWAAFITVGA